MKTLSDKIQIKLNTGDTVPGYVITTLYHNGVGVFKGRSYAESTNTEITFIMNDIVVQNHGKNDCLKLNDDGKVETIELTTPEGRPYHIRSVRGMVGSYTAAIEKDSLIDYTTIYCVSGYDYPNKDMRPRFIWQGDDESLQQSLLCRVMQGCDWINIPDDEIGIFNNGLLPHYPYILTEKFGFGLQLWSIGLGRYVDYGLQAETGTCYNIGSPVYTQSSTTFVTLKDLISGTCLPEAALDKNEHPIYLRYYGSSGDEFGDWEEGLMWYTGHVYLDVLGVWGYKDGTQTLIGFFDEGATFNVYLRRYIYASGADWDYNAMVGGKREVYRTGKGSQSSVIQEMNDYVADFQEVEIPRSSQTELQYDKLTAAPYFQTTTTSEQDPDVYIGKCPVAILDSCYSRYYLAWNDRYGDIMSQPFDGKVVYSEDIETEETADYLNRRKVSHVSVKPKWELNTKWLNQDVYPYYESIFSSPYLLLYDTQTDRSWNVIVTDTKYQEKNDKNEKSLFNLELNVEANENQNMIY